VKIEITISAPRWLGPKSVVAAAFLIASGLVWSEMGFAAWLLLWSFCLILLAIGLLWASVTTVGKDEEISLEDALDLSAPARDEERKLAVLRGIKDLEYERGLGKVSEADFQQLSQRYRKEAKLLLARLDTSDASLRQKAVDLIEERTRSADAPKESNG
jgi:hypothetical protein